MRVRDRKIFYGIRNEPRLQGETEKGSATAEASEPRASRHFDRVKQPTLCAKLLSILVLHLTGRGALPANRF